MTIYALALYVALAALPVTAAVHFIFKRKQNWLMSFLQNFCGILFIISGYVKAVDPIGTAFKLEQYFSEFHHTFKDSFLSFLAPLFPLLSEYGLAFSVVVIVFEIVLGIMLIIGARPKFTSWAFLLLVVFFTFLTGFTYLTGYVPSGVNFFQFGQWGPYIETNMRVTDCGCFGDFIKLKPKISFFKDIFLLFPSIYFVLRSRNMHQLFSSRVRSIILWICTLGLFLFCFRNYLWNEPIQDFRPFKAGVDIRTQKQKEAEAEANRKLTHYKMINKSSGKVVVIPFEQYLKEYDSYPSEEWNLEQIRTEPEIPRTKISDFDVSNTDGSNVTEEILNYPEYSFIVITYKIPLSGKETGTSTVMDSTFVNDTTKVEGTDSFIVNRVLSKVTPREVSTEIASFKKSYVQDFVERINPTMEDAAKTGIKVFAIGPPSDPAILSDLRHATQSAYPFYTSDDLLLKTIIRSNPGVLLLKDGKIVQKWHVRQMPGFEEIRANYMK